MSRFITKSFSLALVVSVLLFGIVCGPDLASQDHHGPLHEASCLFIGPGGVFEGYSFPTSFSPTAPLLVFALLSLILTIPVTGYLRLTRQGIPVHTPSLQRRLAYLQILLK